MAGKGALSPGDSDALTELSESVFAPMSGMTADGDGTASRNLLALQGRIIELSTRIRYRACKSRG